MEHNKTFISLYSGKKTMEKNPQYYMLSGKPAKQCDELINYVFS